jgi:hypothetical protein
MHDLDLTDINVMNSPYFIQPNDYIYIKPSNKKLGTGKRDRIDGNYYYIVSLATTTFLLFKKLKQRSKMLDIKIFFDFEDQVSFMFLIKLEVTGSGFYY